MKKRQALLSEAQWTLLAPLFPDLRRRRYGRGRLWGTQSGMPGAHSLGAAHGSLMAGSCQGVFERIQLLAAVKDVGRKRFLAEGMAQGVGVIG
jgi:hypothetical protein